MTKLVGKSLQNGRYILQGVLGQGGFGITYKAYDKSSPIEVVIKTLNSRLQTKSDQTKLNFEFENEARRLSKCSHPNIVEYKDFFVENGLPYIVMEYIPGVTLDKLIQRNKPLPEATAISYIRQVGEALTVVHQNGLLHRDVKPQNMILRQGTQQVMLIDFGIAREFSPGVTKTHTNLITNGYAPIEQYLPKAKRTAATDVYGLAATLYTLLTAEIPLGATMRERLPFASPKDLVPQLSVTISDAVMWGMALNPQARPSSVSQWLTRLGVVARSEFISSTTNEADTVVLAKPARNKKQIVFTRTFVKHSPIVAGALALFGLVSAMAFNPSLTSTSETPLTNINESSTPTTDSSKQSTPQTIEQSSEISIQPISEPTQTRSPTASQSTPIETQLPSSAPELDNRQAEKHRQKQEEKRREKAKKRREKAHKKYRRHGRGHGHEHKYKKYDD